MKRHGWIAKQYTPLVFAFYMSAIMALLMSAVLVTLNTGINGDYIRRVLHAYAVAMPVAFCCVILVRPLVARLVRYTVRQE